MKVLVVDDHALIRDALRRVLEQLEREVTVFEAGDCGQAFRVIEAQPDLDLVLLDLNLPGMHGLAALTELRTRYPAVSVVVVSAANDRVSVTQTLESWGDGIHSQVVVQRGVGERAASGGLRWDLHSARNPRSL